MGLFSSLTFQEVAFLGKEIKKKKNKRLDNIEKKLNQQEEQTREQRKQEWLDKFGDYYETVIEGTVPDVCKACSNHPSNGGSGVCHCALPYLSSHIDVTNTIRYNAE